MSGLTFRAVSGFTKVSGEVDCEVSYEEIEFSDDCLTVVKKYDRRQCWMDVVLDVNTFQNNPVIDLSLWADKYCWMPCIRIEFTSEHDSTLSGRVFGFENYVGLKVLLMSARDGHENLAGRQDDERRTSNLRGIEFCTELIRLEMCGHNVSDLSPIAGLPLKILSICGNPVSSLDPINFKTLKRLEIDSSHLDLFTEAHDLSTLRTLTVHRHPAYDISTHPWIVSIIEKFGLRLDAAHIVHQRVVSLNFPRRVQTNTGTNV